MVRFRLMSASVVTVVAALGLPAIALRSTEVTSQMAAPRQFGYTGSQQSYLVPSGVMLEGVYVQGAWGGAYGGINQAGATVRAIGACHAWRAAVCGSGPKRVVRR